MNSRVGRNRDASSDGSCAMDEVAAAALAHLEEHVAPSKAVCDIFTYDHSIGFDRFDRKHPADVVMGHSVTLNTLQPVPSGLRVRYTTMLRSPYAWYVSLSRAGANSFGRRGFGWALLWAESKFRNPNAKSSVRTRLTSREGVAEALLLLRRKKHTTTEKPRPPRYLSTLIKHPL